MNPDDIIYAPLRSNGIDAFVVEPMIYNISVVNYNTLYNSIYCGHTHEEIIISELQDIIHNSIYHIMSVDNLNKLRNQIITVIVPLMDKYQWYYNIDWIIGIRYYYNSIMIRLYTSDDNKNILKNNEPKFYDFMMDVHVP